jgi:ubiquinone/menaquinone biosynthesis C-methylase UbiE
MLFPTLALAQKFDDIVAALGVKPGGKIADVGAGDGDYTFKLATAVGPAGKIWAVDVKKSALRELRRKAEEGNVGNVEVVEGKEDNPMLPKGELDAVLVVNAYHEMEEHKAMLGHMRDALKPGGRLVIVEQMPGEALRAKSRIEQQDKHALSPSYVEADLAEAGMERITTTVAPATNHGARYVVVARKN